MAWKYATARRCNGWLSASSAIRALRSADKGNALKELQNILGIKKEETMVFGDNFNDIGMFQQAGASYAVTSAAEEVKKAAKYVAPSYEENGVLGILKKLAEEQE